jgi:SAM-dependent methyltransferase
MDSDDEVCARVRGMWSAVASRWGEHADYVDRRSALVTAAMLELTCPRPGERVLELACGPGSVGLAAAPLVAPGGEVVLSDAVAEMTSIAAARADARGLDNVSTCVLDLDRIDQPDGSYEVVVCREGLMFAADPGRAACEIRRVLRPGGRVALAVWGPPERNPWLSLVFDAVSAQLGAPVPPPGIPGPFSLSNADELAGLLRDAGLTDVLVSELEVPVRAGSFDEWWNRTSALAGPLATLLTSLPHDADQALRSRVHESIRPYETATAIELPGLTLLASAHLPGEVGK